MTPLRTRCENPGSGGTELGLTGTSGRSSGQHLRYEILVEGRPVNPRAYFWE